MQRVQAEAARDLPNNKNTVLAYACSNPDCQKETRAVVGQVGEVPFIVDCHACGSGAQRDADLDVDMSAATGATLHAEFYRPLERGEVDRWRERESKNALEIFEEAGYPTVGEWSVETLMDAEATQLLNGHLVYRELPRYERIGQG